MRTRTLAFVLATTSLLTGCELIASVDHDLITGNGGGGAGTGAGPTTGGGGAGTGGMTTSGGGGAGGGNTCTDPATDCPTAPECQTAICDNTAMCATENVASGTACTTGVCSGSGACVECVDDTQCTSPDTCDTATNTCVAPGCSNGMKDNDETDVDCGGSCNKCGNTGANDCSVDADCLSGNCVAGAPSECAACTGPSDCPANQWCDTTVAGGTCVADKADGQDCTNSAECTNNHCENTSIGGMCCNVACSTGCQSCAAADTGGTNGTCDNASAGTDPQDACTHVAGMDCGSNNCAAGGMCGVQAMGTLCNGSTGDACSGDSLNTADTCNASGTCTITAAMACANNFSCDSAAMPDVCFAGMCTAQSECAATFYCDLAGDDLCHAKKAAGAACVDGYECTAGTCGVGTAGQCD